MDVLLFVFIVSVFVLELRQLKPQYVVKVMRSPDGEQHVYNMGDMSIQRAAVWLLEQYYKDFMVFNPWLESVYKKSRQAPHLMQMEQNEQRSHGNNSLRKKGKVCLYYTGVCPFLNMYRYHPLKIALLVLSRLLQSVLKCFRAF